MIFQQFNLFPHLTAGGNVMLSQMVVKKTPKAEAEAVARKMLDRVGLAHKFDAYPDELSGGQQQRVAIARALAMQPMALSVRRDHLGARSRTRRRGAGRRQANWLRKA